MESILGARARLGGYTGKFLKADLGRRTVKKENVPEGWVKKYLGGRGLCARFYIERVEPKLRPLSPQNELIFFTGPLTGTIVPSSTKYECATKSPITGRYLCTNASGSFGPELKKAGYDGIIISGKSKELVYLEICEENVKFRSAGHLSGKFTSETQEVMRRDFGERRASVLSIGPAGERLVRFASIQSDHRSFGRGGAGAVMGYKKLKGIIVKGKTPVEVAEPKKLRKRLKGLIPNLVSVTEHYRRLGTIYVIDILAEKRACPSRNFQETCSGSILRRLGSEVMKEYLVSNIACPRCPIGCGKMLEAKTPPYSGIRAELDYELVWAFGPLCGIFDYSPIIAAVHLVDEYGMDGISTGYAVSLAMELYHKGLITEDDLNGLQLNFGSREAMISLIEMIGERRGLGDKLAEGAVRAAFRIGKGAENYVMHVKGLSLTGWDPRAMTGMALVFGTSSRGACHNVGGWTGRVELITGEVDRLAIKGKAGIVKLNQDTRAYIDSLGLCTFARVPLGFEGSIPKAEILNLVTGANFDGKLLEIGERIYTLERVILNREGVARANDDMPRRIKTEKVATDEAGTRYNLNHKAVQSMLDEYYKERGWGRDGRPSKSKLTELSILEDLTVDAGKSGL